MVVSRSELALLSDAPGSKHSSAFVVPAAAAAAIPSRRSRIRQRGSSCPLQQAPAAGAGPSPSSNRHRNQQRLGVTANCKGNIIPDETAVVTGGRPTGGPVRVSSGGGGGLGGSNSRISGGRGISSGVNTSRNRMMAAARRGRWTEVRSAVAEGGQKHRVKHDGVQP